MAELEFALCDLDVRSSDTCTLFEKRLLTLRQAQASGFHIGDVVHPNSGNLPGPVAMSQLEALQGRSPLFALLTRK